LRFQAIPENLCTGEKHVFQAPIHQYQGGNPMTTKLSQRIMNNPEYQSLVRARNRFGWRLTFIICAIYYGFIMIIAFDKPLLAHPLAKDMATTWGIPVGFGIILISVILTGIYVRRANKKYDAIILNILNGEMKP
jgi:uncharacterized membrane protein (DUF485 family)